jgi:hypothetical protein
MTIVAVLAIAGCTSPRPTATPTPTPAPTPSPTATPTPTPVPGNQTAEKQYQYVERFYSGIEHYNAGISLMRDANNTSVSGDYTNASQKMQLARDRMDAATQDFTAMRQYASTPTEITLGERWAEASDYESMSFQNASDAFAEYAREKDRPTPNLVKYNYYIAEANRYSAMALESRKQADALQATMTFTVPTAKP